MPSLWRTGIPLYGRSPGQRYWTRLVAMVRNIEAALGGAAPQSKKDESKKLKTRRESCTFGEGSDSHHRDPRKVRGGHSRTVLAWPRRDDAGTARAGTCSLLAVATSASCSAASSRLNGVSFNMHKGAPRPDRTERRRQTTRSTASPGLYQRPTADILMEGASILTRRRTGSPRSASAATFQNVDFFPTFR